MLRTPTIRTKSLADLDGPVNVTFTHKKPNNSKNGTTTPSEDAFSPRAASKAYAPSETQLSRLAEGFRCPVQLGKRNVPEPSAQRACLKNYGTDSLGHNGCVLDPDQPQSIDIYLATAHQILFAQHQVAPGEEIGRLLGVATTCAAMGEASEQSRDEYVEIDARNLHLLSRRTARAMAREAVAPGHADSLSPAQRAQIFGEQERLQPFADKLVHDRSRVGQADRRYQMWVKFSNDITHYCHRMIEHLYPEVVAPETLQVDPELKRKNPAHAQKHAVTQALARKGQQLEEEALSLSKDAR